MIWFFCRGITGASEPTCVMQLAPLCPVWRSRHLVANQPSEVQLIGMASRCAVVQCPLGYITCRCPSHLQPLFGHLPPRLVLYMSFCMFVQPNTVSATRTSVTVMDRGLSSHSVGSGFAAGSSVFISFGVYLLQACKYGYGDNSGEPFCFSKNDR